MAVELRKLCLIAGAFALLNTPVSADAQISVGTIRVAVDGHEMVLFATGKTGPIVILEAGGSSHRAWAGLQASSLPSLAWLRTTVQAMGSLKVCAQPRTAGVIAGELRQALSAAGLEPPHLLVGWSHGGSFVRAFAAKYPESTAGLLLLDPAIEGFYERAAAEQARIWGPQYEAQLERVANSTRGHQGEWAAWDLTMSELRDADQHLRLPITLITSTQDRMGCRPSGSRSIRNGRVPCRACDTFFRRMWDTLYTANEQAS